MVRKPEPIETAFLAVFIGLLGFLMRAAAVPPLAGIQSYTDYAQFFRASLLLIFLCIAAETFLIKNSHRLIALLSHAILFSFAQSILNPEALFPRLALLFILILRISFSFSFPLALGLNIAVSLASTVFDWFGAGARADAATFLLLPLFMCGAFILCGQLLMHYRESLVKAREVLESNRKSLENLAAANQSFVEHLEKVEAKSAEHERLRITRELHDSVGYAMANISMMMNAAPYLLDENPQKLLEYCATTKDLASVTLRDTRTILYKLRAVEDQTIQNPPAFFHTLCVHFSEATRVQTQCNMGNLPSSLSENVFNTLFRAVQVAFINALRHGNAGHISLSFWVTEEDLRMRVWNDTEEGSPPLSAVNEGIGLRGIRERLESLDGTLSYGATEDGFAVDIRIPKEEL